jgi:hypothetical protein
MVQLGSQRVKTLHQTQTPHRMNSDNIYAFVVLQNLADLEKGQGLCSEICPASSHDAYEAISIKAEVFSDAEGEEYPVPIKFPGIKAEPEVSCISVRWISQVQVSLVLRTSLQQTTYICKMVFFPKVEKFYRSKNFSHFPCPSNPVSFSLVLYHRISRISNC